MASPELGGSEGEGTGPNGSEGAPVASEAAPPPNPWQNLVPLDPASAAVELAGSRVPPPPRGRETSSETENFKKLIHRAFRDFQTSQASTDRETLAALAEMQMRLLIEADVPDQSTQLLAQLELHNDLVSKLVWDSLKQKSNGQRMAVNDMTESAAGELQNCLERQQSDNRAHTKWLKGVCEAKVDAARNAGDCVGDDVLKRCEHIFEKQREEMEARQREEMEVLEQRTIEIQEDAVAMEQKLRSRNGVLTKMLNDSKSETKRAQKENAKLKYQFEKDMADFDKMRKKVGAYETAIADGAKREGKLEEAVRDLKRSLATAKRDVRDGKALYEGLLKERDEIQIKCTEMETVLAENADAAAGLQRRIAQAKELDRIHKDEVEALQRQITKSKQEAASAVAKVEDAVRAKENAVRQKKKLENEVQNLADETANLRTEKNSIELQLDALEETVRTMKMKQVHHEEKKQEHSSKVFSKVKSALKVLKSLHKNQGAPGGGSGKGKGTAAEETSAKALFDQAMNSGPAAIDEAEEMRIAKHGKRLSGEHAKLQLHLEDIHENAEEHLTGGGSPGKRVDLKAEERRIADMKKAMENEIRASIEVALRKKLRREFQGKAEKQMRTRLEGEIGRRYKMQMRKKIEEAIARIKMKPDAMREALEAERRRGENLEEALQKREEDLIRMEGDLEAKDRGSAELALLVREKDMLLTELTLLVRAYKGEVKRIKDAQEDGENLWEPPVSTRPSSRNGRPGTALGFRDRARPGSRASTRLDSRASTAQGRRRNVETPQQRKNHGPAQNRRAQSAAPGQRAPFRTSTLGPNYPGSRAQSAATGLHSRRPVIKSSSTNTNLSKRPITAPVAGRPEVEEGYQPDVLIRTALKDSFVNPVGVADSNAIYVGGMRKVRPQSAAVLPAKDSAAIVFGGTGLRALAKRGKMRGSQSSNL